EPYTRSLHDALPIFSMARENAITPETMSEAVYEGGCHCGAVRFRITVREHRATPCNCSICSKKGMVNRIVAAEDFELLAGEEARSEEHTSELQSREK